MRNGLSKIIYLYSNIISANPEFEYLIYNLCVLLINIINDTKYRKEVDGSTYLEFI